MSGANAMLPGKDHAARLRIRGDLSATLLVEAAAGTGKTTELVARIVALLREGRTTLDRILAVTFTDKAAGEMKLRLRAELERARAQAQQPEHDRLTAALSQLEAAQIGTIHSICGDLLRERPVEARVDPLFEVAPQEVAERLFDQAFDGWFERILPAPPEGVRRLLRRRPQRRGGPPSREALREAGLALVDHRDFEGAFRRDPWDRSAELSRLLDELGKLGALAAKALQPEDWLAKALADLARVHADVARREATSGGRDEDGLEAQLRELSRWKLWSWRGKGKWFAEGVTRQAVSEQRDALKAQLDEFLARADADLASCLREELRPVVAAYEALKGRAGCLDFLDLLARARDLVRDDREVRNELQARFTHLLIDEFQDTDPLQAELLLLLAAEDPAERDWLRARPVPGKLFLVGDPKQSVYRFRRADIALYEAVKETLLSRGAELLHLTVSYRSSPGIQKLVNAAFAPVLQPAPDHSQAGYVPLDEARPDLPGQPAVVVLPAPRVYSQKGWNRAPSKEVAAESYADAVGAFVHWLVRHSGWKVTERDGKGAQVPLEARHVCLLFKRLQSFGDDLTRGYVQALEAHRVPHVLVGGRSYHAREEVLALRNAANAIEWPDDELSVFATLRGPLFGVTDEWLLSFRHREKKLSPLRRYEAQALALMAPEEREVAEALTLLGGLHRQRNQRPIAATLSALLDQTRAHAGLAVWPAGEQALANVLRVLDLARRFEAAGATSFRAFVDRLAADEERGDTGEAPVVEEGAEGVRIMSVHRAKGLEFPVVILCDPGAPAAPKNPSRYVDPARGLWAMPLAGCAPSELREHEQEVLARDRAEALRVAYVAATRARDLLVVPASGDGELESWLSVLHPAIYPRVEDRQRPQPAPGCPSFTGRDTVLDRPEEIAQMAVGVAPGLHVPRASPQAVVWWDPAALELGKEPAGGLRREELLVEDEGAAASTAAARAHEQWQAQRARSIERGSVPSLRLTTATAAAEAAEASGTAPAGGVEYAAVPARVPGRPSGKRFGTLLHAVLADADLQRSAREGSVHAATREGSAHSTEAALRGLAAAHGRALGATEAEVEAAASAAAAALAHPLLQAAARSADCRRETPVFLRSPGGELLEGVIDLAFKDAQAQSAGWVVVDFKTDARPELQPAYRAQLQLYVEAVRAATGEPTRGVILAV